MKSYSRPAWLHITPILHVDRVHLSKVIHVGKENIDFDHFIDCCTGFFKNVREILDALMLM